MSEEYFDKMNWSGFRAIGAAARGFGRVFILLVCLTRIGLSSSGCSGWGWQYGPHQKCYVPAPPGQTPMCAHAGLTYCERLDNYPFDLVKHLIVRGEYDIRTLLSDESREEYTATKKKPAYGPYSYGPNSLLNTDSIRLVTDEPLLLSTPYPPYPPEIPSNFGYRNIANGSYPSNQGYNFAGFSSQNGWDLKPSFSGNLNELASNTHSVAYSQPAPLATAYYGMQKPSKDSYGWANSLSPPVTYYNPHHWWQRRSDNSELPSDDTVLSRRKRKIGPFKQRIKKSSQNSSKAELFYSALEDHRKRRFKRQAPSLPAEALCQTRSQYISPKAALNKEGNWMYVVNMGDMMGDAFTQLVKSEVCVSQQCSGLCQLPLGYASRCEQRYVQKRLVALDSGGQQLYTDVFWFPSCCLCTIGQN